MIMPLHNKDGFFKYYTAASAKLTLQHTSRKWSTPLLFNDPFDNQFELHLQDISDELVDQNLQQWHALITSPDPLRPNQLGRLTPIVEYIRQIRQQHDLQYTEEELAYVRGGVVERMERATNVSAEINAQIRSVMADTSIFCVSETHDNLLMWSHYAQNHTGAVIKFLALPEVDSPFIVAQPVRYTTRMPRREFASMLDFQKSLMEIVELITLTKSDVWAYEKEWHIVAALRDKTQSYEILSYAPEEVGAVYLGCKMAEDDREELIGITRRLYPQAKLYQAEKHPREFALIFSKIT
jgi:hypothetical protein